MLLPDGVHIKADEGQHINWCLKNIEPIACTFSVKAVARITAVEVALVAFALGINTSLMCVTRHTVFIIANENCIVKLTFSVFRFLKAPIYKFFFYKVGQHFPIYTTMF